MLINGIRSFLALFLLVRTIVIYLHLDGDSIRFMTKMRLSLILYILFYNILIFMNSSKNAQKIKSNHKVSNYLFSNYLFSNFINNYLCTIFTLCSVLLLDLQLLPAFAVPPQNLGLVISFSIHFLK